MWIPNGVPPNPWTNKLTYFVCFADEFGFVMSNCDGECAWLPPRAQWVPWYRKRQSRNAAGVQKAHVEMRPLASFRLVCFVPCVVVAPPPAV